MITAKAEVDNLFINYTQLGSSQTYSASNKDVIKFLLEKEFIESKEDYFKLESYDEVAAMYLAHLLEININDL